MTASLRKSAKSRSNEITLAFEIESQATLLMEISDSEVRKLATETYDYFAKDVICAVDQHLSKDDPTPIKYYARVSKDEIKILLEVQTKLGTEALTFKVDSNGIHREAVWPSLDWSKTEIEATERRWDIKTGFIKYGGRYNWRTKLGHAGYGQLRYTGTYGKVGALERDGATKEQFENQLAKSLRMFCTNTTLSREQIIIQLRIVNEFNRQLVFQLESGGMSYEFKQKSRLSPGTPELSR